MRDRFAEIVATELPPPDAGPWVVAVSGGLDSVALLHLLRFRPDVGQKLVVAHFDHAMRSGSGDDAYWVRGLCKAWGLDARIDRSRSGLHSEEAARSARYAFLKGVRDEVGGSAILTAHHADDQAETVLFRILRGTGVTGLAGMRPSREGSIYRPLLSFWREELAEYSRSNGIGWREDSTNAETDRARNAIRHLILPTAERSGMPGARKALVRLAKLAARDEAAWDEQAERALIEIEYDDAEPDRGFGRDTFLALPLGLQGRVLRSVLASHGIVPDQAAIDGALTFVAGGQAGRHIELADGVTVRIDLDRIAIGRPNATREDQGLELRAPGTGAGNLTLGGRSWSVTWGRADVSGDIVGTFALEPDQFPAQLRARRPGDRIRLRGGRRKLKKVLLDARVPLAERGTIPVLVDARGEVLWVAGVARSVGSGEGGAELCIGIRT